MEDSLFYQCVVLDNQDPLMLGRVRARLLTDNYYDMVKSFDNPPWNEEKDKWTERDPFIFSPLLPYFMYQVPKVDELIFILYYNKEFKYRNQFYIQALFSSPMNSPFEYYVGAQKNTSIGVQYKGQLPIKNQDGTYSSTVPVGVFPEPGDNAILGRGNADVVVKENGVLIRANKIKGTFKSDVLPTANDKGGFLQITKFDLNKTLDSKKKFTEALDDVVLVNYLIEYVVINPENSQNSFSGYVYLYKLKQNARANSKNLTVDSQIDDLKSLVLTFEFRALTMDDTISYINNVISEINSKNKIQGRNIFNPISKFPIFYRPTNSFYSLATSSPSATSNNLSIRNALNVYEKVKLNPSVERNGNGLIYAENKVGLPKKIKTTNQDIFKYNRNPVTYSTLGGDKVFLLSQTSSIPGKGTINFDGTLYGITNEKFVDEIIPKTSSMVRGEELLELINLIVRFLITHTHSFPGLPPVPVGFDGTTSQSILTELQESVTKILNENIRLN